MCLPRCLRPLATGGSGCYSSCQALSIAPATFTRTGLYTQQSLDRTIKRTRKSKGRGTQGVRRLPSEEDEEVDVRNGVSLRPPRFSDRSILQPAPLENHSIVENVCTHLPMKKSLRHAKSMRSVLSFTTSMRILSDVLDRIQENRSSPNTNDARPLEEKLTAKGKPPPARS
jgi:hypothetical protein